MKITDDILFQNAGKARDFWLSTQPAPDQVPEHKFSRRFEKKMKRLILQQRRSPEMNQFLLYLRRTVAVSAVVFTVAFSGAMTVEAYRARFIEWAAEVFDDLTLFRFFTDVEESVFPELSLGYVPAGLVKTKEKNTEKVRRIYYEDGKGRFFEITQITLTKEDDYQSLLDTEDAVTDTILIRGMEAVVAVKDGDCMIFWSYKSVLYHLYGNLSLDESKRIIEEIEYNF